MWREFFFFYRRKRRHRRDSFFLHEIKTREWEGRNNILQKGESRRVKKRESGNRNRERVKRRKNRNFKKDWRLT